MSVVISYYNDRFALILTDRMVTSALGHWEEQKIYNINSVASYGACAGVGLSNGIYAVRDLLSLPSPIGFNDVDAIDQFLKSRADYPNFEFKSYTAFSVGLTYKEGTRTAYRTKIFIYHICGDGEIINVQRTLTAKNEFQILYPLTYLENKSLYNEFIAENSLCGEDSWSAEKVFVRAKELFSIIQQNSSEIVSQNGDASLLRFDHHSNAFKTTITSF